MNGVCHQLFTVHGFSGHNDVVVVVGATCLIASKILGVDLLMPIIPVGSISSGGRTIYSHLKFGFDRFGNNIEKVIQIQKVW